MNRTDTAHAHSNFGHLCPAQCDLTLQCLVLAGNMTLLPPTPSDSCPRTRPTPPRKWWRAAGWGAAGVLGNKGEYFRHALSWSCNLARGKCLGQDGSPRACLPRGPIAWWCWPRVAPGGAAAAVRGRPGGRGRGAIWPRGRCVRRGRHQRPVFWCLS